MYFRGAQQRKLTTLFTDEGFSLFTYNWKPGRDKINKIEDLRRLVLGRIDASMRASKQLRSVLFRKERKPGFRAQPKYAWPFLDSAESTVPEKESWKDINGSVSGPDAEDRVPLQQFYASLSWLAHHCSFFPGTLYESLPYSFVLLRVHDPLRICVDSVVPFSFSFSASSAVWPWPLHSSRLVCLFSILWNLIEFSE